MTSTPACDTLRVLHLPPYLSDEKRDELFKKYGATCTRTIRKSNTYSTTFVKFPNKETATQAFLRLHQLQVKGRYLSVEFSKRTFESQCTDSPSATKIINDDDKNDLVNAEHFQAFVKKLNTWTSKYDLGQPPPPNIAYKYPSPTRNVLLRIAIQLLREPAFYTQVLHLMNKMNLAPPFEELEEEFPTLKEVYDLEKYQNIFGRTTLEKGSLTQENYHSDYEEESELESDENESLKLTEVIPIKRKLSQSKKRLKIPKFINLTKQHTTATITGHKIITPEEMFESVHREEVKNLKIDLKSVSKIDPGSSNMASQNVEEAEPIQGGFGLMFPVDNESQDETIKLSVESTKSITSEELAANRISSNDQRLLPVFKNYHAGKPSCRLYIKNLSKQVDSIDLEYIYQRYVTPNSKNSESQFDVRLMKEGRMKGQAFVTFQNMGQAQLALNETNGYILKDKPMVVQFAKVTS